MSIAEVLTTFPLTPVADALHQLNLDNLKRFYPYLYQTLTEQNVPSAHHIHLQGDPLSPECRILPKDSSAPSRGEAGVLHGPSPWNEAKAIADAYSWQKSGLIFVLNTGLGYLARYIGQLIYLQSLHGNIWKRVVYVEEEVELFHLSLYLHDWGFMITVPENLLIVGTPLSEVMNHPVLQTYPPMYLDHFIAIHGARFSKREKQETAAIIDKIKENRKKAQIYIQKAAQILHSQKDLFSPSPDIKRILFMTAYMYPMQFQMMGILKSWGMECKLISLQDDPKVGEHAYGFYRKWAWMDLLNVYKPDALFFLTGTAESVTEGSELAEIPIPKIVWYLDDPRRTLRFRNEPVASRTNYFVFCYDKTHTDYMRSLGFRHVFHLPFGTGFLPDFPEARERDKQPVIAYVGTILGEAEILNQRIFSNYFPHLIPILQQAAEEIAGGRWASEHEWLEVHGLPDPRLDATIYVRYLQDTVTNKKRIAALTSLADCGLQTYGGEALDSALVPPILRQCFTGKHLNYLHETPRVYAQSAINLNIHHFQTKHAVPARIYDALAVRGFVISDPNPALDEEFEEGKEIVCYRSEDELKDLCRYYLRHETEREAIAAAGQRKVLEQHTMSRRLEQMFQIIQDHFEPSPLRSRL